MNIFDQKHSLIEGTSDQPSNLFAMRGNIEGEQELGDFTEMDQFIGLVIGDEEFLLPISSVIDINMLSTIRYVPNAPKFIDGVINLRGIIVPAINIRKMMGLEKGELSPANRVLIVKVDEVEVGLIVDGITYVVSLNDSDIETPTLSSKSRGTELIESIGKYENKVHGILDLDKIVNIAADGKLDKSSGEDEEVA